MQERDAKIGKENGWKSSSMNIVNEIGISERVLILINQFD